MYKQQIVRYVFIGAALWVILSLYACTYPQPQELSFETIAEGIGAAIYKRKDPDFFIFVGPSEVDNAGLEIQFSPELAEGLRRLDYQNNFVIVVFRGVDVARTVDIIHVIRGGNDVILKVIFKIPEEGSIVHAGVDTSPYQIISVSKEGEWTQEIRFVLEVDGQTVKERTYFIP